MANSANPLQDTPKKPTINKHVVVCSLLASLCCILPGYDIAVFFVVADEVTGDFNFLASYVSFWYLNIALLCYPLSVLTAARVADWIGRRYTMLFSATIMFAGSVVVVSATNPVCFMVGRICFALGGGYPLMVATLYIAEITPVSSSRGLLTSFPELFFNIGTLVGGIASYWLPKISTPSAAWRFMFGIEAVASLFLLIGFLTTIFESPYWLVMKDRMEDAKRILDKTSGSLEESQSRLEEMRKSISFPDEDDTVSNDAKSATCCVALKELVIHPTPSVRHMFVTALAVHFFQQAIGVNMVNMYNTNIFEWAGVRKETHQQFISYAFGLTGIFSNLLATVLVDKTGRRPLLLYSLTGTAFSLAGLATGLTIIHHHPDQKISWAIAMSIICSLSCTVFFSIGIGPIALIYSSEVFPPRLRALGSGMVVAINFFVGGILLIIFQFLLALPIFSSFDVGVFFFSCAGAALSGWIFVYLFLPETKGATLEEMGALFPGLGSFCIERIKNTIGHLSLNRYMLAFFLYTLYTRFFVSLF